MSNSKWNRIVEIREKNFSAAENTVQRVWESIFIEILGYSGLDNEIEGQRKLRIGSTEKPRPDIVLRNHDKDLFVVELKKHNSYRDKGKEGQLLSYLMLMRLKIGILVSDKLYLYVFDYLKPDNEQLCLTISFEEDNPLGVQFVELFSKDAFDQEKIKNFIEANQDVEQTTAVKRPASVRTLERSSRSCADRTTPDVMNEIERIFNEMNEFIHADGLKRNIHYVGVVYDGEPRTFMKFRPYQNFFHIETKGNFNEVLLKQLLNEGIDVKWIDQRGKEEYYRITLRNYAEYHQHKESIDRLVKQAMTYFGLPYISSQEKEQPDS